MAEELLPQLKEKLQEMEDSMLTLKWDYERGQINPFKKQLYEDQLKAKEAIIQKIQEIENQL